MEPAELVANDDEHAERLARVLDLGKEVGREAEGERDLGRLVEVRLEDVLVEDEEGLEHLQLVLVRDRAPQAVVQLRVRQRLLRRQPLVRQRRPVPPLINTYSPHLNVSEGTHMRRCASSFG